MVQLFDDLSKNKKRERGKPTGGDGQCQGEQAPALSLDVFVPQEHLITVASALRWRWEVEGSGLLLGVELVLQLHEFARSLDLVGNLLPLREEALALLEGQTLRSIAGDRVLLLLTAPRPFVSRVLVDFSCSYNS